MMMDHVMLYLQHMNIIDIELHLETRPMLFVCLLGPPMGYIFISSPISMPKRFGYRKKPKK